MDLQTFQKALARHLHPVLRRDGFKGSGATLRRVAAPLVHVFNLQGSTGADRCYLNLGVQLDFLVRGARPLGKLLEYECEFRTRIDSDRSDRAWHYGTTPEQCDAAALAVVAAWEAQGRPWFAALSRWPEDFAVLVDAFDLDAGHPAKARTMATIAVRLGDTARARAIAEAALARTPESAGGLRRDLQQISGGLATG